MKYVVTGGAGFIGSHIAEYLVDHGHSVTVIDTLFSGKKEHIRHLSDNPHFHFVQGSITSPDVLKDVCRDADGIFHQAAIPSVLQSIKDPVATNDVESGMGWFRCVWRLDTFS